MHVCCKPVGSGFEVSHVHVVITKYGAILRSKVELAVPFKVRNDQHYDILVLKSSLYV